VAYDYAVAKITSTLSSLDDLSELGIVARVFPTITQGESVTLEITTEASLDLNISLLNSSGQTINTWKNISNFNSGTSQQTLDLPASLTTGSYFILVETENGWTALPVRVF